MRIIFIFCCWLFIESSAQRCKVPGESCLDTYQCCGGCCIRNVCIRTYSKCSIENDPCFEHYCPGGSSCQIYQPLCLGCDIVKQCVFINTIVPFNSSIATSTDLVMNSSSTDSTYIDRTFTFYYLSQFLISFFTIYKNCYHSFWL